MSHVILNFVYRLRMYSTESARARGLARRVLRTIIRAPYYFDRLWSCVYGRVLDGVQVIPRFETSVEDEVLSALLGPEVSPQAPQEIAGELERPPGEGLMQKSVRHSSLIESLAVETALLTSLSLQRLQRSLEGSVLTSSLLAGLLVTTAFLFLVLYYA